MKANEILFQQMSNEWAGWSEPKGGGAMEGEYNIKASYEPRGHIIFSVEIDNPSASWCTAVDIDLEAGPYRPIT